MSTKYIDGTGLGTISDIVSERLATKVEAETGKGLSEANFTPVEKSLLATINSSGYITPSQKGAANGIASLGADGKVPDNQLPDSDIVKGYYNTSNGKFYKESSYTTEIIGQNDKLYIDLATPKNYRWNGTAFVESIATLTLGSVEGTAYPGNLGANNATAITQLSASIGDLSDLNTTENGSIVDAINELNSDKQDLLLFDTAPTSGSLNPVTSNGVFSAIDAITANVTATILHESSTANSVPSMDSITVTLQNSISEYDFIDVMLKVGIFSWFQRMLVSNAQTELFNPSFIYMTTTGFDFIGIMAQISGNSFIVNPTVNGIGKSRTISMNTSTTGSLQLSTNLVPNITIQKIIGYKVN